MSKTIQERLNELQARLEKQKRIAAARKQIEDGRKALAALRNGRGRK